MALEERLHPLYSSIQEKISYIRATIEGLASLPTYDLLKLLKRRALEKGYSTDERKLHQYAHYLSRAADLSQEQLELICSSKNPTRIAKELGIKESLVIKMRKALDLFDLRLPYTRRDVEELGVPFFSQYSTFTSFEEMMGKKLSEKEKKVLDSLIDELVSHRIEELLEGKGEVRVKFSRLREEIGIGHALLRRALERLGRSGEFEIERSRRYVIIRRMKRPKPLKSY